MTRTAILVDGGFYRKRASAIWGPKSPPERARELVNYCNRHLREKHASEKHHLYRILYYDCPPVSKQVYHPLLKKSVDLGRSEIFSWTNEFFGHLKEKRKVALRMGTLGEGQIHYTLREDAVKRIFSGAKRAGEIDERDFRLSVRQKGVDMKIGVDIASIVLKKLADQIVLISGDSDFVPVAKLARREGLDFILDPMRAAISPALFEHIDGLRSFARAGAKPENANRLPPGANPERTNPERTESGAGLTQI